MINHCPVCGGVKSLNQPELSGRVSLTAFKLCTCRSKQQPRTFVYPVGLPKEYATPAPAQKQDELTEVMQLFGHPLYVRLDWRDPDVAKYELEQIRSTLKDVFARAEGYESWQAKEQAGEQ